MDVWGGRTKPEKGCGWRGGDGGARLRSTGRRETQTPRHHPAPLQASAHPLLTACRCSCSGLGPNWTPCEYQKAKPENRVEPDYGTANAARNKAANKRYSKRAWKMFFPGPCPSYRSHEEFFSEKKESREEEKREKYALIVISHEYS